MIRPQPRSTLFPYTTLFRSVVAGPLSPLKPAIPFPATVVITPLETLRTRWLNPSEMYRLPAGSAGTAVGAHNWALVAAPLSPPKPAFPLPATVVITPFETLRTRESAHGMYKLPAESMATRIGPYNWALVAGPLSPLKPSVPFPATVVIDR